MESGVDNGGLTVEAHSAFWREVCKSNLFSDGLPAPGAPPEQLVGVGRMLAKSLCDDHVTGSGLARFALEYVVHGPAGRTLSSPRLALEALSECDAELAQRWRRCVELSALAVGLIVAPGVSIIVKLTLAPSFVCSYLDAGSVPSGHELQLSNFDDDLAEEEDAPVTGANLVVAVLAGCRQRLLTKRRASLDALKRGFAESIDLSMQLAPLSSEQLALMVRGRVSVSPEELVECFQWPEPAEATKLVHGKSSWTAEKFVLACRLLRGVLSDAEAINEGQRLALLQWATGLNALPKGGLKDQTAGLIKLLPYPDASEATLPEVHTCTRDMHLPPYTYPYQVTERLHKLLEHSDGGFNKE